MGCNKSKIDSVKSEPHNETLQIIDNSNNTVQPDVIITDSNSPPKEETSPPKDESSGLLYFEATISADNIFSAIKKGEIESVRTILATRPELVFSLGMWSATPLIVALQYNHAAIAGLLLDFLWEQLSPPEQEVQVVDVEEDAPVPSNYNERRQKVAQLLNHRTDKGACALLLACMGDEQLDDVAERLLRRFAGLLEVDVMPTSEAVYNMQSDRSLLCSPLTVCVAGGKLALSELLLTAGRLDVNRPLLFNAFGPKPLPLCRFYLLFVACAHGQTELLRALLARGCDLRVLDHEDCSCLHYIARARTNAAAMLRLLQESGQTPPDGLNSAGEHWLHLACEHRQLELVRLHLARSPQARQDAGCRNPLTGTTPLHLCVRKRLLPLAQLLLEFGADPSQQDLQGQSPWDLCAKLRTDSDLFLAMQAARQQQVLEQQQLALAVQDLDSDSEPVGGPSPSRLSDSLFLISSSDNTSNSSGSHSESSQASLSDASLSEVKQEALQPAPPSQLPAKQPFRDRLRSQRTTSSSGKERTERDKVDSLSASVAVSARSESSYSSPEKTVPADHVSPGLVHMELDSPSSRPRPRPAPSKRVASLYAASPSAGLVGAAPSPLVLRKKTLS